MMFIKKFLNFNKFRGNYRVAINICLCHLTYCLHFTSQKSLLNHVSHVHLPSFRIIIPMRLSPNQIERTMTFLATLHSMARANLKKVNTSQLLLPQHQSTYPRGPESASIEIPTFGP